MPRLVLVSPCSKEFGEVAEAVAQTCPGECIVSIEKVDSPLLEERYQRRKEELMSHGPVREFRVFHGARNASSIEPILADGFKAACNQVAAYGRGTYFATSYSYSKHFRCKQRDYKVMFVCDVAVQTMVVGRANEVLSPTEGDCWVDCPQKPTIFSVPHDHQSIPRYIARFYEGEENGPRRRKKQ